MQGPQAPLIKFKDLDANSKKVVLCIVKSFTKYLWKFGIVQDSARNEEEFLEICISLMDKGFLKISDKSDGVGMLIYNPELDDYVEI